jgi:hypothetical protein
VLVSARADRLAGVQLREDAHELTGATNQRAWTDDYSSLYRVVR